MVLVDTTVWIDLLRRRETVAVGRLRQLIDHGIAAVAPVIVQEILQGAASPESLATLRDHFVALPMVAPRAGAATHVEAAALYARCRWQGLTPRSPHDCLIAQLAIDNEMALLHDDRDFDAIAQVEPALSLLRE